MRSAFVSIVLPFVTHVHAEDSWSDYMIDDLVNKVSDKLLEIARPVTESEAASQMTPLLGSDLVKIWHLSDADLDGTSLKKGGSANRYKANPPFVPAGSKLSEIKKPYRPPAPLPPHGQTGMSPDFMGLALRHLHWFSKKTHPSLIGPHNRIAWFDRKLEGNTQLGPYGNPEKGLKLSPEEQKKFCPFVITKEELADHPHAKVPTYKKPPIPIVWRKIRKDALSVINLRSWMELEKQNNLTARDMALDMKSICNDGLSERGGTLHPGWTIKTDRNAIRNPFDVRKPLTRKRWYKDPRGVLDFGWTSKDPAPDDMNPKHQLVDTGTRQGVLKNRERIKYYMQQEEFLEEYLREHDLKKQPAAA